MSAALQVSVLMPARDAEATVVPAVESLLRGTLEDFELLAIDDHSADGTRSALQRLAARDPRVRLFPAEGRGLVAALNQALALARAPFVARMDADDEAHPRRLEASVRALTEDPSLSGVGTGVEIFRDDRPVSPSLKLYEKWLNGLTTPEALHRSRYIESPLAHPSVCLRRSVLEAAGGFEEGDFPEDYALWLKLLDGGHRLCNLPEVLLRWRDSDGRTSRADARYALRRFTFLKARSLAREPRLRAHPGTVFGTGPEALALVRFLRALGVPLGRLVDVNPRKVGTRVEGLPVVHLESVTGPGPDLRLLAVGAHGAREELRGRLTASGHVEGQDFLCVA